MPKWLVTNLHQSVLLLAHDVLALYLALGIPNLIRAGVWSSVDDACDRVVRIPMSGSVESLNVSVAAGVVLFEVARQRVR